MSDRPDYGEMRTAIHALNDRWTYLEGMRCPDPACGGGVDGEKPLRCSRCGKRIHPLVDDPGIQP